MLETLEPPMRRAFDLAWQSWGEGNFGIGAVLVDPGDGATAPAIVSEGRNRVTSRPTAEQPLGGNYLAHAEMNAFAALPRYNAAGLELFSTLEPCLMCAASSIFMNVAHVTFAADDEFFDGMDDQLWPAHPYTRDRRPARTGPLGEALALLARLLPMHHTMATIPDSRPADRARAAYPALADLAASPSVADLRGRAATLTLDEGASELAARLETIADEPNG